LTEFNRQSNSDIPDIFIVLVKYFDEDSERLKSENLFKNIENNKNDMKVAEALEENL
jgi:hypothetical protein